MSKDGKGGGHLLFVSKASGYELVEGEGEAPAVGAEVEAAEAKFHVAKIGASPLPGDSRLCAYLQPV